MNSPTSTGGERPGGFEIAGASFLVLLEAVLAFVLSAVIFFASIRVAGCAGQNCDLAAGQASVFITPVAGAIAVVLTIGFGIYWGLRRRPLWIPPVIGMGLILAAFVVAFIINTTALTPTA